VIVATIPARLPQFFIRMLTNPGDLVVDIFAGSNRTGMVAEQERRCWKAFDEPIDYLASSAFRFLSEETTPEEARGVYDAGMVGESVKLKPALQEVLGL
jgi:DNA modification methylase